MKILRVLLFVYLTIAIQAVSAESLDKYMKINTLELTLNQKINKELTKQLDGLKFYVDSKVYINEEEKKALSKEEEVNLSLLKILNDDTKVENTTVHNAIDHIEITVVLDEKATPLQKRLAKAIVMRQVSLSPKRGDKVIVKYAKLSSEKPQENSVELLQELHQKQKDLEDEKIALDEKIRQLKSEQSNHFSDLEQKTIKQLKSVKVNLEEQIAAIKSTFDKNLKELKENEADTKTVVKSNIESLKIKLEKQDALNDVKNKSIYSWLLLLIVGVIVFLIVLFLITRNSMKTLRESVFQNIDLLDKSIQNVDKNLKEKIGSLAKEKESKTLDVAKNNLQTIIFSRKKAVKEFIKENMSHQEGLKKVALLFKLVGQNTMKNIFDANEKHLYNKLVQDLKSVEIDETVLDEETLAVVDELESLSATKGNKDMLNPFEFINTLELDQIMLLLEDEDYRVQALIVSQLSKDIASQLLELKTIEDKVNISLELGQVSNVSKEELEVIGERLTRKLATMPKINNYIVDGKEQLVDILHMMKPEEQQRIMTNLKTQNNALYEQMRSENLFFIDFLKLDDDALKEILAQAVLEDLAAVLLDTDEAFRNRAVKIIGDRKFAVLSDLMRDRKYSEEEKKTTRFRFFKLLSKLKK